MKKNWGTQNWAQNQGFCFFLKFELLVFLDIAKDCSFGQCLTSSRAKTSKKGVETRTEQVKIGAKMIIFLLTSPGVQSNLLVCKEMI